MAIYDLGTASLASNGEVTGVGTTWKAPLTLIRVGATIVFKTEPVKIYTISEIISDTQVNVYNPNSETVPAGTGYAILAHDGITVQGLAQDVAETLRYYQSQESNVAQAVEAFNNFDANDFDAKVSQVSTQHGDVVTIGAQVSSDAAQVSADKDSASSSAASAALDKNAAAESAQEAADYAASLDMQNILRKDLNLSDISDRDTARGNLNVYSKSETSDLISKYIDWVIPDNFKLESDEDDTNSFLRALAVSKRLKLMARIYLVKSGALITRDDDVLIIGEGSNYTKIMAVAGGEENSDLLSLVGSDTFSGTVRQRISVHGLTIDGNNISRCGLVTRASQSPNFIRDVVITRCKSHGLVHERGWSTIAIALSCRSNGGDGIRLNGDNNNTIWQGFFSENDGSGFVVKNSAFVSISGSIENNGAHGLFITASTTKPENFENIESSVVTLNGAYVESNSRLSPGTYSDIQVGGGGFDGQVRDCSIINTHIGVMTGRVGINFSSYSKKISIENVGIYPVLGSSLSQISFSGAYKTLQSIVARGYSFRNVSFTSGYVTASGLSQSDVSELQAFIIGGGSIVSDNPSMVINATSVSPSNNLGGYLERVYRGPELIHEHGVKPNVQVWNNAASSAGYHSYAIAGTEVLRINQTNIQPRTDNSVNLGAASTRWGTVYAGTGTINTSDERLKQEVITDAEKHEAESLAAAEIKKSIYRFKFKDAVEAKSEGARIHFGVSAQKVQEIMKSHGLDAADYAFWCHDCWGDEFDSEGNKILSGGDRFGIRYEELLAFIIFHI